MQQPELHPRLALFFSQAWADALSASLSNVLSNLSHAVQPPALLQLWQNAQRSLQLQQSLEKAQKDAARLRVLLRTRDRELQAMRR